MKKEKFREKQVEAESKKESMEMGMESKDVKAATGEGTEGKNPSNLPPESKKEVSAVEAVGHQDEEQDKELIKKMIVEYLGGGDEMSSAEVMEMCKEVYQAFNEMGYPVDKAMMACGHVMKYAKYLSDKGLTGEKSSAPESDEAPDVAAPEKDEKMMGEKPEAEEETAEAAPAQETEESESESESETKESEAVITLKAENAALKEQLKQVEIQKYLEKTLQESGLPRAATSKFKESVQDPKSTKEIDDKFKLFVEAYNAARGSATEGLPFVVTSEKKSNETRKTLSFTDCVR